jgi:hypothetical protein
MNEATTRVLMEELESIYVTNVLYWIAGEESNRAARAEYKRRQDRLREIRADLYGHLVALGSVIGETSQSCLTLTQRA